MGSKYSPVSFFSLHLEMMLEGKKIGDGTGFIYQPNGINQNFLITNYHIITSSSPREPELILNGYPDCPDELQFHILKKDNYTPIKRGLSLKKKDDPKWIEHKDRSNGVDIVALPINFPNDAIVITQKQLGLVDNISIEVGSDLFIVGFPYGYGAGDFFPIWKRGTVASEPSFRPEGLNRFYIDSYTKPGMSGSPVFAVEIRDIFNLEPGQAKQFQEYESGRLSALDLIKSFDPGAMENATKKKFLQLVGIYSGRISIQQEKDPNVGIVWQKKLIDELFIDPQITNHPFPIE